ncbi:hypothetical protein AgCh_024407 [Apium graveolens]
MYDDIAYDEENPRPGVIINSPHGSNVYNDVPKDYTREDVTVNNIFAVILGNKSATTLTMEAMVCLNYWLDLEGMGGSHLFFRELDFDCDELVIVVVLLIASQFGTSGHGEFIKPVGNASSRKKKMEEMMVGENDEI